MMATDKLTFLGRPYVSQCKVYATIQEQTFSTKKVTYRYIQKKGVRKSKNKKVRISVLKIDKIVFTPEEAIMKKAVRMEL